VNSKGGVKVLFGTLVGIIRSYRLFVSTGK